MEKKPIIETKQLSVGYRHKATTKVIAHTISIQLQKGKLYTLVGANGIGKSTLLRTLSGIQKPLASNVTLYNRTILSYEPIELAKNLSLVLTEKLPTSNLSVYELIALGRQPYTNWLGTLSKNDEEKINEAIALTQIEHLLHKKHHEISDGQLQIVLIARALAQDTPIIILDEPTTHLDLFHKVTVFKLLKKLSHETGKCILFSTHDIDMAIQVSDEMIVITEEKVMQDQPCNFILNGVFDTLFKDASIRFDKEKGKYIISG